MLDLCELIDGLLREEVARGTSSCEKMSLESGCCWGIGVSIAVVWVEASVTVEDLEGGLVRGGFADYGAVLELDLVGRVVGFFVPEVLGVGLVLELGLYTHIYVCVYVYVDGRAR